MIGTCSIGLRNHGGVYLDKIDIISYHACLTSARVTLRAVSTLILKEKNRLCNLLRRTCITPCIIIRIRTTLIYHLCEVLASVSVVFWIQSGSKIIAM